MKSRRPQALVLVLIAAGTIPLCRRFLFPAVAIHAATTTVGPAQSFLLIMGVGETAAANWDGTISVTGAQVEILRGWRFEGTDAVNGTTGWKLSTRVTPSLNPPGPVQENGVIVKVSASSSPVKFDVTTTQGNSVSRPARCRSA
jgi:hypothetical protein